MFCKLRWRLLLLLFFNCLFWYILFSHNAVVGALTWAFEFNNFLFYLIRSVFVNVPVRDKNIVSLCIFLFMPSLPWNCRIVFYSVHCSTSWWIHLLSLPPIQSNVVLCAPRKIDNIDEVMDNDVLKKGTKTLTQMKQTNENLTHSTCNICSQKNDAKLNEIVLNLLEFHRRRVRLSF